MQVSLKHTISWHCPPVYSADRPTFSSLPARPPNIYKEENVFGQNDDVPYTLNCGGEKMQSIVCFAYIHVPYADLIKYGFVIKQYQLLN